MRVPACRGTRDGLPTVFSLVHPDVGVSEGRDARFNQRLTCFILQGTDEQLAYPFSFTSSSPIF